MADGQCKHCSNPTKQFVSSGKFAKCCAPCLAKSYTPRPRKLIRRTPVRVASDKSCVRCGRSIGSNSTQHGRVRTVCGKCKADLRKRRRWRQGFDRKPRTLIYVAGYCKGCGVGFVGRPAQIKRKYQGPRVWCSDRCRQDYLAGTRKRTCLFCGCEYFKKKCASIQEGDKFCGSVCAFSWKSTDAGRAAQSIATAKGWQQSEKLSKKVVAKAYRLHCQAGYRLSQCQICKKAFFGTALCCSSACSAQYQWDLRFKGKVITCIICKSQRCPLPGRGNHSKTCSPACTAKHEWAVTKKHKRIYKAQRRAVERSVEADRIDPLDVFKQDRWKCHLCGCRTPKKLRGTYDPRAPELDHVVPLAQGGTHTLGNVRCACRECNGLKGSKIMGQLNLLGGSKGCGGSSEAGGERLWASLILTRMPTCKP